MYKSLVRNAAAMRMFARYRDIQACGNKKFTTNEPGNIMHHLRPEPMGYYPPNLSIPIEHDMKEADKDRLVNEPLTLKPCPGFDPKASTAGAPACRCSHRAVLGIKMLDRLVEQGDFTQKVITLKTSWLFRFFENNRANPSNSPIHTFITIKSRPSQSGDGMYTYEVHLDKMLNYLNSFIGNMECLKHGQGKCAEAGHKGCVVKRYPYSTYPAGIREAIAILDYVHIAMLNRYHPSVLDRVEASLFAPEAGAKRADRIEDAVAALTRSWKSVPAPAQPIVVDGSSAGLRKKCGKTRTALQYFKDKKTDQAEVRYRLVLCQEIWLLRQRFWSLYEAITEVGNCAAPALLCDPSVIKDPISVRIGPSFTSAEIAALHQKHFTM